jgi:hypothetical protein
MKNKGEGKFSSHALNRAEEIGLSCADLVKAWFRSTTWELDLREKEYKFKTYGMESLSDFYYFDQVTETLFTCHQEERSVAIIITVTKMPRKYANKYKINRFLRFMQDDYNH